MPKGRWKKRKHRDETNEQQSDQPAKKQKTGEWKEWVKENPRYESYYKVRSQMHI